MATFKFSKGYRAGFFVTGMQDYLVSTTGRCEDLKVAAMLLWIKADQKIVQSPGNQLTTILAATKYTFSRPVYNGIAMTDTHCERRVTFTPMAGHQYAVVSRSVMGGQCDIDVIDEGSGRAPADLDVDDGAACVRVYERERALAKAEKRR